MMLILVEVLLHGKQNYMKRNKLKELSEKLESKELVIKNGKKTVDKTKLLKEFEKFSKINKRVDEGGAYGGQGGTESARIGANPQAYATGFNPKAAMTNYQGYGKTVNTFIPTVSAQGGMKNAAFLQPSEALSLSIRRALESGAPVNNLDFYGEVNWNLNNMGFDSKQPLDIKEALRKMLKEK